jgi:hypothetical protein
LNFIEPAARRQNKGDKGKSAGLGRREIVETVANVALNIFENYMSHIARIPIDFPQDKFAGHLKLG